MIQFIIYVVMTIGSYRFIHPRFYDARGSYDTDSEVRLVAALYAACWPVAIPGHVIWAAFGLLTPKSPQQKRAECKAEIEAEKRELYRLKVERADLEHENGFDPIDPPEGWVPKGDRHRYYKVDRKLDHSYLYPL